MVDISPQSIPEVLLIKPERFGDERGFFSETYREAALAEAGFHHAFVQDNHSVSEQRGTVRGLHLQRPPFAQAKLVRVIAGCILDVVIDIRTGSPTYGHHVAVELSADNWLQLLAPAGFAHGFQTLTPGAAVIYKVTEYYRPDEEEGLLWCDPDLGVDWPISQPQATVNARDGKWPSLKDFRSAFTYTASEASQAAP